MRRGVLDAPSGAGAHGSGFRLRDKSVVFIACRIASWDVAAQHGCDPADGGGRKRDVDVIFVRFRGSIARASNSTGTREMRGKPCDRAGTKP